MERRSSPNATRARAHPPDDLGETRPNASPGRLADIDGFEAINDAYGHAAGDRVLQRVAEWALAVIRSGDLLARYGGEEFLLLAPETDLSQAVQLAERIRVAQQAAEVSIDHTVIRFRASFGVVSLREDDRDASAVVARADQELYAAKEDGRNRVVAA
jgi:diguanylate cyclase (GGDEF)-like protein